MTRITRSDGSNDTAGDTRILSRSGAAAARHAINTSARLMTAIVFRTTCLPLRWKTRQAAFRRWIAINARNRPRTGATDETIVATCRYKGHGIWALPGVVWRT